LSKILRDEACPLDGNYLGSTFVIDPKDVDPVKLSGKTATGAWLCSSPPCFCFYWDSPTRPLVGFVYCKCDSFTHYHICIHAWGLMKLRKFVKQWPLDVTKIPRASKKRRIANITRGGALGRV
jgi:hypothetical protein